MATEATTRSLIVVSSTKVYTGTSSTTGKEFSIYEVIATTAEGAPITKKLTSFSELPVGPGEYEVSPFVKNGQTSYTLKIPKGNGLPLAAFNALVERVTKLEADLAKLQTPPTQATPSAVSYVDDPDDIPF